MTVTFFENQKSARKKTLLLLFLYGLAVVCIIFGIYFGILFLLSLSTSQITSADLVQGGNHYSYHAGLFLTVSGFVIIFIFFGSMYKIWQLSKGGAIVAQMLGGRLITHDTQNPTERKVLNIVDEMAIATGIAVPPVYLMDHEDAINAFAAGFKPSSAVIGVSRGAIEQLTRDELQGVIAHEFSHIFNGDMALNIRLMGVLHGILVIAMAGYTVMRITGGSRRRSEGNGQALALGVGLILLVIGYAGVFSARLIKMAVSRQREYLADASAVQFTRNPLGIGNALRRILANSEHGYLQNQHAEEVSHMFFTDGIKRLFGSVFATHPPLKKRIAAIARLTSGGLDEPLSTTPKKQALQATSQDKESKQAPGVFPIPGIRLPGMEGMVGFLNNESSMPLDHQQLVSQVGTMQSASLIHAQELLQSLDAAIAQSAQEPCGAMALLFYVLLDADLEVRHKQFQILEQGAAKEVYRVFASLVNRHLQIKEYQRLPILDICLPTLKQLSNEQYQSMRGCVHDLIYADEKVSLFEFCLESIVIHTLDLWYGYTGAPRKTQKRGAGALLEPVSRMLFALAFLCNDDKARAYEAYLAGTDHCGIHQRFRLSADEQQQVQVHWLEDALHIIETAKPDMKHAILQASIACVSTDQQITIEEYEVLRAIASLLECPLPPLAGLTASSRAT